MVIKHLKFGIVKALGRDVSIQSKEAECTSNRTSLNECIPRHNTIKLLKIKNKEKIKTTKENDPLPRKKDNSNTADFIRNHKGQKEEA